MLDLMKSELRKFARDIAADDVAARFEQIGDDQSLPEMVGRLAEMTGEAPGELRHAFGRRAFERFAELYPDFIPTDVDALDYMLTIERHVQEEMRFLFPAAQPPQLCCKRVSATRVVIRYSSREPMAEMCAGMIEAALAQFEARILVTRRDDADCANDTAAIFDVTLLPAD